MTITFFTSWQLWEQMTFVLGCAIVLVFCVGYVKLIWTNRIVKKLEIVDEEKRMKIEQLRRSGQMVDTRKDDVPFGVRAIQSGIQIDGIWISGTNTPVPSINLQRHSSYAPSSSADSSSNAYPSLDPNQPGPSPSSSRPGRPGFRHSESVLTNYRNVSDDETIVPDHRSSSRQRATYKPMRSSQLRFDTVGEHQYDEETLGHLEGKAPASRVYTHRPRGARHESDSSSSDAAAAADNERSSSTSDDSDNTFSNAKHRQPTRNPQVVDTQHSSQYSTRTPSPETLSPMYPPVSFKGPKGKDQYFSIPMSADDDDVNPFSTPRLTPTNLSMVNQYLATDDPREQDIMLESQAPLLNEGPSSQFVPGELHANKSVRKVNSGFEVLPAGTFGTSGTVGNLTDVKGKGVARNDSWEHGDSEERKMQPNKLQKKSRFSLGGNPNQP